MVKNYQYNSSLAKLQWNIILSFLDKETIDPVNGSNPIPMGLFESLLYLTQKNIFSFFIKHLYGLDSLWRKL